MDDQTIDGRLCASFELHLNVRIAHLDVQVLKHEPDECGLEKIILNVIAVPTESGRDSLFFWVGILVSYGIDAHRRQPCRSLQSIEQGMQPSYASLVCSRNKIDLRWKFRKQGRRHEDVKF